MKTVLVANRGEIACRVFRACREAGLGCVAVVTEPDRGALHAEMADRAVPIDSYLKIDDILAAAKSSGADAIHPGYGFLSESAVFAEAVVKAGLTWIGPPATAIRRLGDKMAGKSVAQGAFVPTVPGYSGEDQSDARLKKEAAGVGFPLLVKAAGGGGGRGMRVVEKIEDVDTALASARREAKSGFGDDRLLLEKYCRPVRHVEVQIMADRHGSVIHLGERDCSVQRRHQKVIEESPSPAVSAEMRDAMGRSAVALAKAVGYENAGTVEFIVDTAGKYYFLEVNTRLQVEHPVTEAVTGLDLVRLQLDVAAGRPLPLRQEDVTLRGHAIELRIYAEDPERDFMPSPGTLHVYQQPQGVRIDTGVRAGAVIPPDYDPMIAKLIATGRTRPDAIAAARRALAEFPILGVRHNIPFLDAVLAHPDFASGKATTDMLDRQFKGWKPEAGKVPAEVLTALAASEPSRLQPAGAAATYDPWRAADGWRNA